MMYIMTSEHTKLPTEKFFEKHNFFGLEKSQVVFFEQRMIPCFDAEGKIILETRSKVSRAPDGNGGLYWALKHENVLAHMKSHGVKYLHVYCVDNVLVKVADPMFMGYCIDKGAESGNKVVEKNSPHEAVGVVCKVDGKFQASLNCVWPDKFVKIILRLLFPFSLLNSSKTTFCIDDKYKPIN